MESQKSSIPVDVRRTCKAIQAAEDDPEIQPGEYLHTTPGKGRRFLDDVLLFTCPGCGRLGSIRATHPKPSVSPSWDITAGSLDDITTLTLTPSIHCQGCCGWHGYLTNGEFRSC